MKIVPIQKKQKSIAILICYLGKLPWYFDYYIHSCRYNLSIDFYIITDSTYAKENDLPPNVKLIKTTLSELSTLATEKFIDLRYPNATWSMDSDFLIIILESGQQYRGFLHKDDSTNVYKLTFNGETFIKNAGFNIYPNKK